MEVLFEGTLPKTNPISSMKLSNANTSGNFWALICAFILWGVSDYLRNISKCQGNEEGLPRKFNPYYLSEEPTKSFKTLLTNTTSQFMIRRWRFSSTDPTICSQRCIQCLTYGDVHPPLKIQYLKRNLVSNIKLYLQRLLKNLELPVFL